VSNLDSLVSAGTHGSVVFRRQNALLRTRMRARSRAFAAFLCCGFSRVHIPSSSSQRSGLDPPPRGPFAPPRLRRGISFYSASLLFRFSVNLWLWDVQNFTTHFTNTVTLKHNNHYSNMAHTHTHTQTHTDYTKYP
jgi:hypothetical protein